MPSKACKASGASKLWHQTASDATKQALISNGRAASMHLHVQIHTLAALMLLASACSGKRAYETTSVWYGVTVEQRLVSNISDA